MKTGKWVFFCFKTGNMKKKNTKKCQTTSLLHTNQKINKKENQIKLYMTTGNRNKTYLSGRPGRMINWFIKGKMRNKI